MNVQKPVNYQIKEQNVPCCVPAVVPSDNPITSFKECQPTKHRQAINYSFLNVNLIMNQLKLSKHLTLDCV